MKKKAIPEKSANDWVAIIMEHSSSKPVKVPEGWLTMPQIANEMGLSLSHTAFKIRIALKAGEVETQKFTIDTGRKIYPVPHYRIVT